MVEIEETMRMRVLKVSFDDIVAYVEEVHYADGDEEIRITQVEKNGEPIEPDPKLHDKILSFI